MKTYVIPGRPGLMAKTHSNGGCKVKDYNLIVDISLASQHGDIPLYQAPIHLEIKFCMPLPRQSCKKIPDQSPHVIDPDLLRMAQLLQSIAQGVIYDKNASISSIALKKIYDINPRTEITIVPLK